MDSIFITPHDPDWSSLYLSAEEEIRAACAPTPLLLFHIGSTAIPALAAKPIIDILGEVEDLDDIDRRTDALAALGFKPLGEFGMVQRRYFKRPATASFPCPINFHVFAAGDPQIERHRRFRDYLRAHPFEAEKYDELKQSLAVIHTRDLDAYTEGKNRLIHELDRKALLWPDAPAYRHFNAKPRPQTWTESAILSALEANLSFHMTHLIRYVPEAEYSGRRTVSWVSAPVKDDTFNNALHAHLQREETEKWIDRTIAHYQSKNHPFSWWIKPSDEPKDLPARLTARGFRLAETHQGMFAKISPPLPPSTPLKIERILDPDRLSDFCAIAEQLGLSKELYPKIWKRIPPLLYQKGTPIEIYVGIINGKPAVSGLLVFYGKIAGIYWIATIPSERKKGYAGAMMTHLLQRAHEENYQIAGLLASPMGQSLYQKFGFSLLADFYEFAYG